MHPRPALPTPYVAPGSQAEQELAAIWSDILGIEQIGIHDSFLDFGGDSLQATQLTSRIREAFQVDLPLRSFFETPTIAGIVAAIDRLQAEQAEQAGYDAMEILRMIEQLSEDAVADELQRRKAGV